MINYFINSFITLIYPLLGICLGISGFYRSFNDKKISHTFFGGEDMPWLLRESIGAFLINALISSVITNFNLPIRVLQMFGDLTNNLLLISYVVNLICLYIIEIFIGEFVRRRISDKIIEESIYR